MMIRLNPTKRNFSLSSFSEEKVSIIGLKILKYCIFLICNICLYFWLIFWDLPTNLMNFIVFLQVTKLKLEILAHKNTSLSLSRHTYLYKNM